MFENLKESIGEAFTDDLRKELESKINEAVNTKSEAKVQALLEEKTDELNEACEEYKAQLAEEAHKTVNEKINEINEMVDKYVDYVVDGFIKEHEETFRVNEEELRTHATLNALRNACLAAGVNAQKITESIYTEERIEENRGCSYSDEQLKILGSLSKEIEANKLLKEENEKLIRMGIVAEMCSDLNEAQTAEFEKLAENVEFTRDRSFINSLDEIKARIVEEDENEDEDEDEDSLEESVGSDIVRDLNESLKSNKVSSNDMYNSFMARMKNLV